MRAAVDWPSRVAPLRPAVAAPALTGNAGRVQQATPKSEFGVRATHPSPLRVVLS